MLRENIHDLMSFIIVAREKSFTRAAAQLGVSQSALSHAMRGLEERLGTRLLTRTTRNVSATDAGLRLITELAPMLDEMQQKLSSLHLVDDVPRGNIRITAVDHAIHFYLWPKLSKFLKKYPEISLEINNDYSLVDIVEGRFDAGVRLGEHLAQDMIAVKIAPDMRMAIVATPEYFAKYPKPINIQDLTAQDCLNLRTGRSGGLYPWELDNEHGPIKIRTKGRLIFNNYPSLLQAARDGLGLAYIPENEILDDIEKGIFIRVLEEYCLPFPSYYLYYPNRRHQPLAFQLMVDALRYRG